MITFDLNGEKHEIPTCWENMPYRQFIDTVEFQDRIDALAYFFNVPRETLLNARANGVDLALGALSFMDLPPKIEKPEVFMGIKMPEDITFEALGPYLDCKKFMSEAKTYREILEVYAKMCAIYVQCVKSDWKYDYDKIDVDAVMRQPTPEVVALGAFFTSRLLTLRNSTRMNYRSQVSPQKKRRPVFQSLRKRLEYCYYWMVYRYTLASQRMRFFLSGR